jgi:hypothetical protein
METVGQNSVEINKLLSLFDEMAQNRLMRTVKPCLEAAAGIAGDGGSVRISVCEAVESVTQS